MEIQHSTSTNDGAKVQALRATVHAPAPVGSTSGLYSPAYWRSWKKNVQFESLSSSPQTRSPLSSKEQQKDEEQGSPIAVTVTGLSAPKFALSPRSSLSLEAAVSPLQSAASHFLLPLSPKEADGSSTNRGNEETARNHPKQEVEALAGKTCSSGSTEVGPESAELSGNEERRDASVCTGTRAVEATVKVERCEETEEASRSSKNAFTEETDPQLMAQHQRLQQEEQELSDAISAISNISDLVSESDLVFKSAGKPSEPRVTLSESVSSVRRAPRADFTRGTYRSADTRNTHPYWDSTRFQTSNDPGMGVMALERPTHSEGDFSSPESPQQQEADKTPAFEFSTKKVLNVWKENRKGPAIGLGGRVVLDDSGAVKGSEGNIVGPGDYSPQITVSSEHRSSSSIQFPLAARALGSISGAGESPGPVYSPKREAINPAARAISFARAPRVLGVTSEGQSAGVESSPGPIYSLPSSISLSVGPSFASASQKAKGPPPAVMSEKDAQKLSGFGYGCNVEEHIKYGQCLDGKCSQRSAWEKNSNLRADWLQKHNKQHAKGSISSATSSSSTSTTLDSSKPAAGQKKSKVQRSGDALLLACTQSDAEAVATLLLLDVDLNAVTPEGDAPIHLAVVRNEERILRMLLEAPTWLEKLKLHRPCADIDKRDRRGRTAIHLASEAGNLRIVEYLVEKGADLSVLDCEGRTPLKACGRNQKVYQLLRLREDVVAAKKQLKQTEKEIRQAQQTLELEQIPTRPSAKRRPP